jgi:hypothetical protein
MITTRRFHLTPVTFFKLLCEMYIKRRWWLMAFIIIMGLINAIGDYSSGTFFIIMAVIYPVLVVFQLWRYAASPENRNMLLECYYEIDEEEFRTYTSEGSTSSIKLTSFIKAINLQKYYLLYISKAQFIVVTKDCFESRADRDWFEKQILHKIK